METWKIYLELTHEDLIEVVQVMQTVLTTEQLLEGIPPKQRLEGIPSEQRLEGIPPEQIKAYLQKIGENLS